MLSRKSEKKKPIIPYKYSQKPKYPIFASFIHLFTPNPYLFWLKFKEDSMTGYSYQFWVRIPS